MKLLDIEVGGWFRAVGDLNTEYFKKEGETGMSGNPECDEMVCVCISDKGYSLEVGSDVLVTPLIHTPGSWRDDDGTMSLAEAVEAAGCDGTTKLVDSNIYCDTDDRGCIDFYFHYEGEDSHIADHGAAVGYKELGGRWTVVKKGESDESV